jgi:hypothetical protein
VISPDAFERARLVGEPFRHFLCQEFIAEQSHNDLLDWLETNAPWKRRTIADFIDVFSLDLGPCPLPAHLEIIRSAQTKELLCHGMEQAFDLNFEARVDVGAQKMIDGQYIRVHNDFGEFPQTHQSGRPAQPGMEHAVGRIPAAAQGSCARRAITVRPLLSSAAAPRRRIRNPVPFLSRGDPGDRRGAVLSHLFVLLPKGCGWLTGSISPRGL